MNQHPRGEAGAGSMKRGVSPPTELQCPAWPRSLRDAAATREEVTLNNTLGH